uniref:H15 domain-containing protein n=1 Tax=Sparus aurata TaxID=8175 RepID=A0A671VCQ2_SPAAU
MVEVAPAPAKAATKTRVNKPRTGPGLSDRIVKVVSASNERGGVSGSAIKKALKAGGYDVERNNGRVKLALRNLVLRGTLIQAKGSGINGSFKISKKAVEPKAKRGTRRPPRKTTKSPRKTQPKRPPRPGRPPRAPGKEPRAPRRLIPPRKWPRSHLQPRGHLSRGSPSPKPRRQHPRRSELSSPEQPSN